MRTFYIFNVNKEMSILTKDSPYMLFKSFESIFRSNRVDLEIANNLYHQLASRVNKNIVNDRILNEYKDNQHYMCVSGKHNYVNKYRGEECNLEIKNSFLKCVCKGHSMCLMEALKGFNFFACDFENKDYFWLDEICC